MSEQNVGADDALQEDALAQALREIERLKAALAASHGAADHGASQAAPAAPASIAIATSGGAVVGNGVRVSNGHFIGRDYIAQLTQIVQGGEREEDVNNSIALYLHVLRQELSGLPLGEIDTQIDRAQREALTLRDVYVPLNTTLHIDAEARLPAWLAEASKQGHLGDDPREVRAPLREFRQISVLEALAAHPRLTLLGNAGSGKSSACAHLLLALADAWAGQAAALEALGADWTHGGLLPIRIVLREFADALPPGARPGAGDLWRHLGAQLRDKGIGFAEDDQRFLQRLALGQGALVVFDGLDECGDLNRQQTVMAAVEAFIETYRERCRFVLTMRPLAWQGQAMTPLRGEYLLDDFDDGQIVEFIERWYSRLPERGWCSVAQAQAKSESLLGARHRPDLAPLAKTPLLLTLMALLHSNRGRLPDDRVDLYHETVELLLRRWSLEEGDERALKQGLEVSEVKWSSVRRVIQQLAFEVHAQSAGREGDLDIRESALLNALRPLFGGSRDKAALMVEYIERRTGLLLGLGHVVENNGPLDNERRFGFPHRSFREYLAACHLAEESPDFEGECRRLAAQAPGHWELALTLAARIAKLSRGARAADALVGGVDVDRFEQRYARRAGPPEWRAARIAGMQLLELGLGDLGSREDTRVILDRVRHWLAAALPLHPDDGGLPAVERAQIGDMLAQLGDPRFDPELLHLPADPHLGFVRIPADPDFRIGTRSADCQRVAEASGEAPRDHEINDQRTPTPEFWIARYPVTVAQFRAFVDDTGFALGDVGALRDADTRPVCGVSWVEANAYVEWLQRQWCEGLALREHPFAARMCSQGWRLMLPGERLWEKAARGSRDGRVFPWGDRPDPERANTNETGIRDSAAVGTFPPTDDGLYDIAGNIWEWTGTEYAPSYSTQERDASERSSAIVVRGGGWYDVGSLASSRFRYRVPAASRRYNVGFRVVLCGSPSWVNRWPGALGAWTRRR